MCVYCVYVCVCMCTACVCGTAPCVLLVSPQGGCRAGSPTQVREIEEPSYREEGSGLLKEDLAEIENLEVGQIGRASCRERV